MKNFKSDYNSYIQSNLWSRKREEAFSLHGRSCQRCKSIEGLHVHHKTYDNFKNENILNELAILCDLCHSLYHQLFKKPTIKSTNYFIKRKSLKLDTKKRKRDKKLNKKYPTNKKLLNHKSRPFIIDGKRVSVARIQIHNPLA